MSDNRILKKRVFRQSLTYTLRKKEAYALAYARPKLLNSIVNFSTMV